MESATIRTPLEVVWHKRSALASCIAIDLAHLIRYSQKGGGVCVGGGGKSTAIRSYVDFIASEYL